ncbi:B3/4 domain protein [Candidatus Izimaplasma bacterium HR1]|jgi:DNA/RNA-binding domain of Phe-tRNA-synthetase-like protein|uniref:B3/B4 domain-containing protein n=1 Tax=Candidatus Izimoplasma sp. HR1 TaxID=1541959 RepID=UPI0004F7BA26|nr:B3/4 domain protein [Candidatus Izimaplasma bacterium HR1]
MKIVISSNLKSITPNFNLGIMIADVKVKEDNRINDLIISIEKEISESIDIKDVVNLPIIKDGRDAYKKYGKDPSRYRLATESLIRRLAKGNKLYRINNLVDLGNILSIRTRKSIAVLDYDKIQGDVLIRLGKINDDYYGIGRGKINIENVPLYEDDLGPFGSGTSDTERTMITSKTKRILLFIVSFSGTKDLSGELSYAKELYETHADASKIDTFTI